jgi:hypothetical protein
MRLIIRGLSRFELSSWTKYQCNFGPEVRQSPPPPRLPITPTSTPTPSMLAALLAHRPQLRPGLQPLRLAMFVTVTDVARSVPSWIIPRSMPQRLRLPCVKTHGRLEAKPGSASPESQGCIGSEVAPERYEAERTRGCVQM